MMEGTQEFGLRGFIEDSGKTRKLHFHTNFKKVVKALIEIR